MLQIRLLRNRNVVKMIDAKWTIDISVIAAYADELQPQFLADDWDVVNERGAQIFNKARWTLLKPLSGRESSAFINCGKRTSKVLAMIALFTLFSPGVASATCSTAEPNCAGRISFGPFMDHSLCFSVFQVDRGHERRSDFCLHSSEKREVYARTGDRFCGVRGEDVPPFDCVRSPMNIP
jgi:hypothetical protein